MARTFVRFNASLIFGVEHVSLFALASGMTDGGWKMFVSMHVFARHGFDVFASCEFKVSKTTNSFRECQNTKTKSYRELSHLAFKSLARGKAWISPGVASLHVQSPFKQVHNSNPWVPGRTSLYPAWKSRPSCWHLHWPIGMHSPLSSK